MFISFLFFILLGVLMLARPSIVWLVTEGWLSKEKSGPSTIYIWTLKVIGILFLFLGIVGIFVYTFMN